MIANIVTISGVGFILLQMRAAGSYSSAAVVTGLCANVRVELERLGTLSHDAKPSGLSPFEHGFRNLLNELELAAAIVLDKAASARSGKIVRLLLIDVLSAIQSEASLINYVERAVHQGTTFENLADFIRQNRKALPRLDAVM